MSMNADQIFQAIQGLPPPERRKLVERVANELDEALPVSGPPLADPFLGLLADAPDLADEILRIAVEGRHEGREAPDDDENAA